MSVGNQGGVTGPDFAAIAREAKPVRAGCCDCGIGEGKWTYDSGRDEALAHGKAHGHFVWIESIVLPEETKE